MLRITRRAGERIILGDNVIVEVMEVKGGTVRLGIDAPRSLPIYREEIWLEVKRENEEAARAAGGQLPDTAGRLPGTTPPR
jgi:carbon storage regulator